MGQNGEAAGSVGLRLVIGVPILHPQEQVFARWSRAGDQLSPRSLSHSFEQSKHSMRAFALRHVAASVESTFADECRGG